MSTNNTNQDLMTALESLRKLIDKDNVLGETIDANAIPTLEPSLPKETANTPIAPPATSTTTATSESLAPDIDDELDINIDQLALPELVEFEAQLEQQKNDARFEQFWQLLAPKLKVVCKECFDELEKNTPPKAWNTVN